jgi:hypothetical protein
MISLGKAHQGRIGQFDLQVLHGGTTKSQKVLLMVSDNSTFRTIDPKL